MALPPSAVISSVTTITPAIAAAATAYQHSFPLTPDGSCGNPAGTASGDNAASNNNSNGVTSSSIYEPNNGTNALQSNNKSNNKDSMGSEEHNQQQRQQDSYSAILPDSVAGLDNGQGLIQQQQSENSEHHTPSYYTK
jgi:hypothetical protein